MLLRLAFGRPPPVAGALHRLTRCASSWALPVVDARFNGLRADLTGTASAGAPAPSVAEFSVALAAAVDAGRAAGRGSLWLVLSTAQGALMPAAAALGFAFHHAEGAQATLHLWLPAGVKGAESTVCPVPPFATHVVGCAGVTLDERGRLLVVKEHGKSSIWKMPGGYSNLGEDWGDAAVRETWEETGVRTTFASVLALRHQHGVAWGRSDLYVMCRLRPLSELITIDPREIKEATWVDARTYIAETSHPLNRYVAQAALDDAAAEQGAAAAARSAAAATVARSPAMLEETVFIAATGRTVKCYRSGAAERAIVETR